MGRQSLQNDDPDQSTLMDDPDVFDDEYAVEDSHVADGFAPSRMQGTTGRTSGDEPRITSVAAHMMDDPAPIPQSRLNRNSMRKSRVVDNPFSSTEDDDAVSPLERTPSQLSQSTTYAPVVSNRPLSMLSTTSEFARTSSPLHVDSVPSHPYAMYTQGTNVGRTPSVSTTTSTLRPAVRSPLAQRGPTHPYSMYPQNVEEDLDDDATEDAQTHIPVGFPARSLPLHRRVVAASAEDAIIAGADGHAEQLPAYSEYPEDGAPRHVVLPVQANSRAQQVVAAHNAPPAQTPIQAPALVPLLQPVEEPQSMSDATTVGAAPSMRSIEPMESNDTDTSGKKSWSEKSWKEKRKTKFCGVPFWWIMLALGVVTFIAIVLGGAIGGLMSSNRKAAERAAANAAAHGPSIPSATLFDASALPSATCTPLPTGTFALKLGGPEETQSSCLTNSSQTAAWSCNIPPPPALAIEIAVANTGPGPPIQSAKVVVVSDNTTVSYGTQPPQTDFSTFQYVTDLDDAGRGPAYLFQAIYDKVVVVQPSAFYPAYVNSKRSAFEVSDMWFTQHEVAIGAQPWFCFFNATLLEGFIYLNDNLSSVATATNSSSVSSSTTATSLSSLGTSLTSSSTSWSGRSWTSNAVASQVSASSRRAVRRDNDWALLPSLDYIVKLEERRVNGSLAPYCQKMDVAADGTASPVLDASGSIISFGLSEIDPSYQAYASAGLARRRSKRADTEVPGACHCEWISGS